MKKTFLLLFLFCALISCGKDKDSATENAIQELEIVDALPDPTTERVSPPSLALTFKVKPKLIGFSKEQKNKLYEAINLIKKVVASEDFKKRVLNKKYEGIKTYVDNGGLTNKEIYQIILEGAEKLGNKEKNNTMDVTLELYTDQNSTTIGYTYPSVQKIWMNQKYFNNYLPYQVANNLFHEWLHKLGFKHEVQATDSRRHSVPYAVGDLVGSMAKRFYLDQQN
jgi:hypothetical protein